MYIYIYCAFYLFVNYVQNIVYFYVIYFIIITDYRESYLTIITIFNKIIGIFIIIYTYSTNFYKCFVYDLKTFILF